MFIVSYSVMSSHLFSTRVVGFIHSFIQFIILRLVSGPYRDVRIQIQRNTTLKLKVGFIESESLDQVSETNDRYDWNCCFHGHLYQCSMACRLLSFFDLYRYDDSLELLSVMSA